MRLETMSITPDIKRLFRPQVLAEKCFAIGEECLQVVIAAGALTCGRHSNLEPAVVYIGGLHGSVKLLDRASRHDVDDAQVGHERGIGGSHQT